MLAIHHGQTLITLEVLWSNLIKKGVACATRQILQVLAVVQAGQDGSKGRECLFTPSIGGRKKL